MFSIKGVTVNRRDPFRQDKLQLAIKSIEALVKIVERFHDGYYEKLKRPRKNGASGEQNNEATLDNLKLFKGKLMPFQKRGVNWLVNMYENDLNGILGDEMGLGKTVQLIAFICFYIEKYKLNKEVKILIIVPLSVLPNWIIEFKNFAPKLPVHKFHGNKDERNQFMWKYKQAHCNVLNVFMKPIIVTSYENFQQEIRFFQKYEWDYLILDEAHRIKNEKTQIINKFSTISFQNTCLLTGTPFQNDLKELWSLLRFLFPNIFDKHKNFKWLISADDLCQNEEIMEHEQIVNSVASLHKILDSFMLRRIKADVLHDVMVPKKEIDVYCGLSETQKKLYYDIIQARLNKNKKKDDKLIIVESTKRKRSCVKDLPQYIYCYNENCDPNIAANISYAKQTNEPTTSSAKVNDNTEDWYYIKPIGFYQQTFLRMKQVVDHPYLLQFPVLAKDKTPLINERLITESGKMIVLDKMLKKLFEHKHKVLIFSMSVMTLDLIEELMIYRNLSYRRFDGGTETEIRQENIEEFNRDENIFAFLLSTLAGGLGINLTGADTVIFYDRSWNPQHDIQAQGRCHRIGQTKPVMVFTLVAKNTVDERIIDIATAKRRLEKIVIKNEDTNRVSLTNTKETYMQLYKMISENEHIDLDEDVTDQMITEILDRSELYEKMVKKEEQKK